MNPTISSETPKVCATQCSLLKGSLWAPGGEAGCKTVIASRLKRSGMFWTVRGANEIIALRCSYLNRRVEDYWESGSRAA
jgi:hypothetical protein